MIIYRSSVYDFMHTKIRNNNRNLLPTCTNAR